MNLSKHGETDLGKHLERAGGNIVELGKMLMLLRYFVERERGIATAENGPRKRAPKKSNLKFAVGEARRRTAPPRRRLKA